MEKKEKIILVTGATGQQGGAVARHLLKGGWKVRAFVRDDKKKEAIELKENGAEIIKGDMADTETLDKAMAGVYGVFSVQNFWEHGYEGELKQGLAVADAAKKADVKHFLMSSVGGAERKTSLPHFDVKFIIEEHIKEIKLNYTIIRPVFFMENLKTWFKPEDKDGVHTFTMAMKADRKLQMIAVDDIGAIAAVIFNNPDTYLGKELEIAGDELTIPEVAEIYSKVTGHKSQFAELPVDVLISNSAEVGNMFKWFNEKGYRSDLGLMKEIHAGLTGFESWAKNNF